MHGSGFPAISGSEAGAGWLGTTAEASMGSAVLESWLPPLSAGHCLLFRLLRQLNIQDVPLHSLRQDGVYGLSLDWKEIKEEWFNHREETSLVTEKCPENVLPEV